MTTTTKIFETERDGDTIILIPQCNLSELEYDNIESDAGSILEWIELSQVKHAVIDLNKTDYYGSTALGFFTKLWKRIKTRAGHMALCNVSAHEREILDITHLSRLWSICDSRDEAVRAVHDG